MNELGLRLDTDSNTTASIGYEIAYLLQYEPWHSWQTKVVMSSDMRVLRTTSVLIA